MKYIKLMRIHHYIKNILIFVPLFFSKKIYNRYNIIVTLLGFIIFSMLSSSIYIINDINDIEEDKKHPIKCKRPLASGDIGKIKAIVLSIVLVSIVIILNCMIRRKVDITLIILMVYFLLNIIYSIRLKEFPIIDVVILAFGYVIRLYYGAILIGIDISSWLYLSVLSLSFFLGFGKRRNELEKRGTTYRKVLVHYSREFLDKILYTFLGITIVFYALWCEKMSVVYGENILFTVFIVIVILLKYSLNIEKDSDGDPVDVILGDKVLLGLGLIYGFILSYVLYYYK